MGDADLERGEKGVGEDGGLDPGHWREGQASMGGGDRRPLLR